MNIYDFPYSFYITWVRCLLKIYIYIFLLFSLPYQFIKYILTIYHIYSEPQAKTKVPKDKKPKPEPEQPTGIAQIKLKKVVRKKPSPEEEPPKERVATPEPIDTSEVSVPEHGKLTELETNEPGPRESSPIEDSQPEKDEETLKESKESVTLKKRKPVKKAPAKGKQLEPEVEVSVAKPDTVDSVESADEVSDSPVSVVEETMVSLTPDQPEPTEGTHPDHLSVFCIHHICMFTP